MLDTVQGTFPTTWHGTCGTAPDGIAVETSTMAACHGLAFFVVANFSQASDLHNGDCTLDLVILAMRACNQSKRTPFVYNIALQKSSPHTRKRIQQAKTLRVPRQNKIVRVTQETVLFQRNFGKMCSKNGVSKLDCRNKNFPA